MLYGVGLIQMVNVLANVSLDATAGTFQAVHLPTIYFSEITVNIIYHHCRGFQNSLLPSVFDQNFVLVCPLYMLKVPHNSVSLI
jgi:hypothetical protein